MKNNYLNQIKAFVRSVFKPDFIRFITLQQFKSDLKHRIKEWNFKELVLMCVGIYVSYRLS